MAALVEGAAKIEMKHLIFTFLLLTAVVVPGRTSPACFCIVPEVAESFARADAVFVGKVIGIEKPKSSAAKAPLSERLYTIRFKVVKSWKGDLTEKLVLAQQGEFGCFAYPVVGKGERYLVYADPAYEENPKLKKVLVINSCNRTALLPLPGMRSIKETATMISRFWKRWGY